jgi:hypothetical protein
MITKFELFESINYDNEKLVRIMAWLSLVLIYGDEGLNDKDWSEDNRIGIKFKNAIPFLRDKGLISIKDDSWVITNKGINKLKLFFNIPKNREEFIVQEKEPLLLKYDSNMYIFSNIPNHIYEYLNQNMLKNSTIYSLFDDDYEKINKWFEKYQRGTWHWVDSLNKYCGRKGDLFPNINTMTLYRGINLNEYSTIKSKSGVIKAESIKIGDKIICKNPSWTLSLEVAKSFAFGRQVLYDNLTEISENEIGIILKHEFQYTDILLDANWINDNHNFFIEEIAFPKEYEIIVKPKSRLYDVVEVYT